MKKKTLQKKTEMKQKQHQHSTKKKTQNKIEIIFMVWRSSVSVPFASLIA